MRTTFPLTILPTKALYLSKSCVVDKELSFVFKNKKIEEAYKNKYGEEYEQEFKAN